MCELFGLSSDVPVSPGHLLCRFGEHGGHGENPDGWGLGMLGRDGFHIEKRPEPAAYSERFQRLCREVRSTLIIGHVRKANPPTAHVLANTHPFTQFCCGRDWIFAHNGIVSGMEALIPPQCKPSGDTDTERAFCVVLDGIASAFAAARVGDLGWLNALAKIARTLAAYGRFNFLMSDGTHLLCYGHDRLHSYTGKDVGSATIIATEPLSAAREWERFEPGELRVYRAGREITRLSASQETAPQAPFGLGQETADFAIGSGAAIRASPEC